MTTIIVIGLSIIILGLVRANAELSTKLADITRRYDQADKRASVLYDANVKMRREKLHVVKDTKW